MGRREHFPIKITCPSVDCDNMGEGTASEDEQPWSGHLHFQIDRMPPRFSLLNSSYYRQRNTLKCNDCGEVFNFGDM